MDGQSEMVNTGHSVPLSDSYIMVPWYRIDLMLQLKKNMLRAYACYWFTFMSLVVLCKAKLEK